MFFVTRGSVFFSVITQGKSIWKFFVQKSLLNVCFEIKNRYICKPYNTDNN